MTVCRLIRALSPNVIAPGEILLFVKAMAFSVLQMICISPSRCIQPLFWLLMLSMLSGAWASTVSVLVVSPKGYPLSIPWLISSASATIRVSVPLFKMRLLSISIRFSPSIRRVSFAPAKI